MSSGNNCKHSNNENKSYARWMSKRKEPEPSSSMQRERGKVAKAESRKDNNGIKKWPRKPYKLGIM
jgi:hypothetical protein